jgi:hypothetical protein
MGGGRTRVVLQGADHSRPDQHRRLRVQDGPGRTRLSVALPHLPGHGLHRRRRVRLPGGQQHGHPGHVLLEAAGSFHTPYSESGFQSRGIFESDSNILLENHEGPDPRSDVISSLTVEDFVALASPITHIVHADGRVTGDSFKYDFGGSAAAQVFKENQS